MAVLNGRLNKMSLLYCSTRIIVSVAVFALDVLPRLTFPPAVQWSRVIDCWVLISQRARSCRGQAAAGDGDTEIIISGS